LDDENLNSNNNNNNSNSGLPLKRRKITIHGKEQLCMVIKNMLIKNGTNRMSYNMLTNLVRNEIKSFSPTSIEIDKEICGLLKKGHINGNRDLGYAPSVFLRFVQKKEMICRY